MANTYWTERPGRRYAERKIEGFAHGSAAGVLGSADAFECTGLQHSFTKFRESSSREDTRLRQTSQ